MFESGSAIYMSNYLSVLATITIIIIPRYIYQTESQYKNQRDEIHEEKIKQFLKILDSNVFNGHLRKIYEKLKENQKKQFFHGKKSVVVEQSVPDLILMQYNTNEYMEYQFFDVGVRYLAIENYYKKNGFGYYLYKKMHTNGGNYGHNNKQKNIINVCKKRRKRQPMEILERNIQLSNLKINTII